MLKQTQAEGLVHTLTKRPVKVLAICSGKGGVGKTNVASNIAVALAATGLDVCLLDADTGLANVDVLFGLTPRLTLSNVVDGSADIERIMLPGPQGLRVVPASSGIFSMIELPAASQAAIVQAFSDLKQQPDILIVDTAAGISAGVARFVQAAQHPVVVIRDEPASLTDAYALIKVFSRGYGILRFHVVTNQSMTPSSGRALFKKLLKVTDSYLDVDIRHMGDVPNDQYLLKAVQAQRAVVDMYPASPSGRAFRRIGKIVSRMRPWTTPVGGIEFFFERMLANDHIARGKVA